MKQKHLKHRKEKQRHPPEPVNEPVDYFSPSVLVVPGADEAAYHRCDSVDP